MASWLRITRSCALASSGGSSADRFINVTPRASRAFHVSVTDREAAFAREIERLFDVHFGTLFRYLQRLSGDPDLAADLAQETFVRLYQRGAVPDDPRGWLGAVANNLFRDERRRTRRRGALLARELGHNADPRETADITLVREEQRGHVRDALSSLPERDRQILLLRQEGFSYREIAVAVNVAESGVGTLLVRAMRAFRARLTSAATLGSVRASE